MLLVWRGHVLANQPKPNWPRCAPQSMDPLTLAPGNYLINVRLCLPNQPTNHQPVLAKWHKLLLSTATRTIGFCFVCIETGQLICECVLGEHVKYLKGAQRHAETRRLAWLPIESLLLDCLMINLDCRPTDNGLVN